MSYTTDAKQYFLHTLSAISQFDFPDALKATASSLESKVSSELNSFLSRFENSEDILKMPSMGIISITHEKSKEPMSFFATDIRSRNLTLITIHQAAYNRKTSEIIQGEVLAEFYMSEAQFGEMMINPNNGSGYPATLNKYDGKKVRPYLPEDDYSKGKMPTLISDAKNNNRQVESYLKDIQEYLDNGKESGRIKKGDIEEINKLLSYVAPYTADNATSKISRINKALQENTSEATLNIHLAINELAIGYSKEPLMLEDSSDYSEVSRSWYTKLSPLEKQLLSVALYSYMKPIVKGAYRGESKEIEIIAENGESFTMDVLAKSVEYLHDIPKKCTEHFSNVEDNDQRKAPKEWAFRKLIGSSTAPDIEKDDNMAQDSHVMVSVFSRSGFVNLFDHPSESSRAMCLEVKTAKFYDSLNKNASNDYRFEPSADRDLLEVALSPEQFVRAMRSDSMKVSCSIIGSFGEINDLPPRNLNKTDRIKKDLTSDLDSILKKTNSIALEMIELIGKNAVTSKKKIAEIQAHLDALKSELSSTQGEMETLRTNAMQDVAEHHMKSLKAQIDFEIKKLPLAKQQEAASELYPIIEDLRQR